MSEQLQKQSKDEKDAWSAIEPIQLSIILLNVIYSQKKGEGKFFGLFSSPKC
jgi:hypothetical protein